MKLIFSNGDDKQKEINIKGKCTITDYDPREKAPGKDNLTIKVDNGNISIMNGTESQQEQQTVTMNAQKYSIFTAIAGMDGDKDNLTQEDIAKAKKIFNSNSILKTGLKLLGVTDIRYDSHAGVATIVYGNNQILRIDFQTRRERWGIRKDSATQTTESDESKEEELVAKGAYVQGKDENMPVRVVIDGKERYFTYNIAVLEDYAASHSHMRKDSNECWFENIPEIRAKAPKDRTEEEISKLAEFDTMIEYIVNIGVEYGVEPNFIAAIIRKEIGYDGMLESWAHTKNGQGYMQLTRIAIKDMFMHANKYGDGLAEVMESRGFDIHCPKEKWDSTVDKVMELLKTTKDPEFNIRLGTIKLRRLLNESHGDIKTAAKNYNGNKKIKNGQQIRVTYSKEVKEYYAELTARSK